MTTRNEGINPKAEIKSFRLAKFDGDPPAPGDTKEPVEVIEDRGDGVTRRWVRVDGQLKEVK